MMNDPEVLSNELLIDTKLEEIRENEKKTEIKELIDSLNYAHKQIEDLKQSQKKMLQELKSNKEEIEELKRSAKSDHERIVYLDDYTRRNSLRFRGVPEAPRETWEQCQALIVKLLREVLGISPDIERAHRIEPKRTDGGCREIIVKFTRHLLILVFKQRKLNDLDIKCYKWFLYLTGQ